MGQAIFRLLLEKGHDLTAAFDAESSGYIGKKAGQFVHRDDIPTVISLINPQSLSGTDTVIDFSSPGASLSLLNAARNAGKALVIGTTGFSDREKKQIEEASSVIPIVFSPNMSVGVNLLFKLTEMASSLLQDGYDIEVFEAHHKFKKDAPSGTAKKLLEIIKDNVPRLKSAPERADRTGILGERPGDEIGVMVMRGGDIVGEHTVFFVGMGERIELTHRALNRDNLARGAVLAAEFLQGKQPGLYTMFDVLGL